MIPDEWHDGVVENVDGKRLRSDVEPSVEGGKGFGRKGRVTPRGRELVYDPATVRDNIIASVQQDRDALSAAGCAEKGTARSRLAGPTSAVCRPR